jgi:hypothetical protein
MYGQTSFNKLNPQRAIWELSFIDFDIWLMKPFVDVIVLCGVFVVGVAVVFGLRMYFVNAC